MTRTRVLITRKIFEEVITMVRQYFQVEDNQSDVPLFHRS
jgi:hypothetical protein